MTVCQGTVRAQGHNSRWASLDTTQPFYLCRACFAEDVPEPQGLISSSGDDGLPIRRHGLQKGQTGLGYFQLQQTASGAQTEAGRCQGTWTLG